MAQDPKTVVQRVIAEVWNAGSTPAAEELIAEDLVWHHTTLGELRGRQAMVEAVREMRAAFPDMQIVPEAMAVDGDRVMFFWVATGTHQGPYRGAAPSGQRVTWRGMVLDRVADGKVVERWAFADPRTPHSPHAILSG
jgi:steroid delta-isomerase-like uncharacterized protein